MPADDVDRIVSAWRRERPALRVRLDVSGTQGVSRAVADGEDPRSGRWAGRDKVKRAIQR